MSRVRRPSIVALIAATALAPAGAAQEVGRDAVERLRFPELRFDPPVPVEHTLPGGVTVYLLEDHTLPLVHVMARFRGGYSHFGRESYAAGTALPGLMRSGGTTALSPDSVDRLLEFHAIQTTFGGSGESLFSTVDALSGHLGVALSLWGDLLVRPGFDPARVEVWRGQELESVRRRVDDPGGLAFSAFNRLMFGDHPIGWEMTPEDLGPGRLSPATLSALHRRIVCPENAIFGVTGAVTWERIGPLLEALVADWPACPGPVPEAPSPEIRTTPGVFLIPRPVDQSVVVLAHVSRLRQGDSEEFFASRIANAILGASGFRSRLMARIRTEEGLAYGVSSLWTAPIRYDGVVGATTRTRPEATVEVIELVREVMRGMIAEPPEPDEVQAAVDEATHGFVFNFDSPAQIVSRRMSYQASGLPADWLERYLAGIQGVEPGDVHRTVARHLDPDRLVILVVGDPDRFGTPLGTLGPVTVIDPEVTFDVEDAATPPPSGWPRSPG